MMQKLRMREGSIGSVAHERSQPARPSPTGYSMRVCSHGVYLTAQPAKSFHRGEHPSHVIVYGSCREGADEMDSLRSTAGAPSRHQRRNSTFPFGPRSGGGGSPL